MREIQLHRLDLNLLVVFEMLMLEGSVARAADRLGKTPSAVSHALARLREQTGDPLMVRVNGQMRPSPFALTLIDEVRPILRSIRRVMAPPVPFDPARSDRLFRISMPAFPRVVSEVCRKVAALAPGTRVEWVPPDATAPPAVLEGLVDLAHLGGDLTLPEGLEIAAADPFRWITFARRDHPAIADWSLEAWRRWPHLQVRIGNNVRSPVEVRSAAPDASRHIGAIIAEASGVGGVLAESDFLATFSPLMMYWQMQTHGLVALKPPIDLPVFPIRFYWSARLANDPGSVWFRTLVLTTYAKLNREAEMALTEAGLVQPRPG
jgi:DNA-binding transcriptional LysR family regulator